MSGGGAHGDGVARLAYRGVAKWYGNVSALSGIGFEVGAGVVGLVGRNGAGKSTLINLAAGLLAPSQGSVEVCGHRAGSRAANRVLGFSPDLDRLYERCTGLQFVAWMLRLHGVAAAPARGRAAAMLDELGLGDAMHRQIREYSKGMRQRVRLAQALAHGPRLLLLDEPMTGLDPVSRRELGERIAACGRAGVGVLVSSHVLHELEQLVDRVVLVHQGRLVADGPVASLRSQLRDVPHRLRVHSERPRDLAVLLCALPQVGGVAVSADGVDVSLSGMPGFYPALTGLGAGARGLVLAVTPLDDSLASVFGYLVG